MSFLGTLQRKPHYIGYTKQNNIVFNITELSAIA
jgi:hypothetical protein